MAIVQDQLSGVYLIRCGKKVYVGSSIDIHHRWDNHKSRLRTNHHDNNYLQLAWNQYGESAFAFEIIELCMEVVRVDRENYWIRKLKAADRKYGYNITGAPGDRKRRLATMKLAPKTCVTAQLMSELLAGAQHMQSCIHPTWTPLECTEAAHKGIFARFQVLPK